MNNLSTNAEPKGMRTFFIIWLGQLVSLIGSELSAFGLGVWIFEKTHQATPFALVALTTALPRLFISPFAGVLVDRWNRRWIMMIADTISALMTLSAAFLLFSNQLAIWHVYVIVLVSSICSAFQEPAYMASITMLVPKKDFGRANGMMQASEAFGRLVAPMLAGVLYVAVKLSGIFVVDFVSFFFAVGALMLVRIPQPEIQKADTDEKSSMWTDVLVGWRYLTARAGLVGMLIYFALVNFLLNLSAVLGSPLILNFAKADAYGLVQSVAGLGMLVGSIAMSTWGGPKRKMYGVYSFIGLMGAAMIVIGLKPSVPVIAVGYFIFLFALPMGSGSSRAIWQAKVEPKVQGRVFATRSMISTSMVPLAFLIAGPLADKVFGPLMIEGGALADTVAGQMLGVGAGRGVGLIFVIAGAMLLVVTAVAYAYPRMRLVEDELPDVVPDVVEQELYQQPDMDAEAQPLPA
jgi:MFS transporter, DHA3 family, macrolide efflux protein